MHVEDVVNEMLPKADQVSATDALGTQNLKTPTQRRYGERQKMIAGVVTGSQGVQGKVNLGAVKLLGG